MTSPRAVVFDLGKVLLDFDYGLATATLACHCKLTPAELLKLIDQSPLLHRYETGLLSTEEFCREVCSLSGYGGEAGHFQSAFGDIFSPIPRMIELHAELCRRAVPTYIFSNTNELAIRHIRRAFPFFSGFTDYILSYEHGAMKPNARLYEVVESRTGARGGELLYIDDREENILAGAQRGWRTIHHHDPEKTWNAIRHSGLL